MGSGTSVLKSRKVKATGDGWQARILLDPANGRLKLTSYEVEGPTAIADLSAHLTELARTEEMGKVVVLSRQADWPAFLQRGFGLEGFIDGYLQGEQAYVLCYFTDPERQASTRLERENAILEQVLASDPLLPSPPSRRFNLTVATPDDADEMAKLFDTVFVTYPDPLESPAYLRDVIESEQAVFVIARDGDRLVSAAGADIDWEKRNAEMTHCATLPEYRGHGLMAGILAALEPEMMQRNIGCLYSLARASSHGMNLVLRRLGYRFQGRMINSCHIMGDFEDMNIWVKA